ncbi:MAG: hypothetical protein ABW005_09075 [Burkholderiaceae bacterium]
MDKQAQMQRIAAGLNNASRKRDWQALRALDRELAGKLRQWADAPLNAAERGSLQRLRESLGQALQSCAAEQQLLGQTLEHMREGRERWQAYAASTAWNDQEDRT